MDPPLDPRCEMLCSYPYALTGVLPRAPVDW
jgi:hypothetical protein